MVVRVESDGVNVIVRNVNRPSADPPWPPGKPTVKDVAKTSCFLMWTKPEHDGGAKIDGYIIEMLKSGTMDWIRVADNINILEHFLKGLMEKQEYSFRIRAVNVAGESEPSEPSDPVLCKERLSKSKTTPTITLLPDTTLPPLSALFTQQPFLNTHIGKLALENVYIRYKTSISSTL